MNVILNIAERQALAVWTLPYVTSWRLSPDVMLRKLCGGDGKFPTAFSVESDDAVCSLPPEQWCGLANRVAIIDQDLTDANLPGYDDRAQWEERSIGEFWNFESAYVWLDEFEQWWRGRSARPTYVKIESISPENTDICLNPILPKRCADYFQNHVRPRFGLDTQRSPATCGADRERTKLEKQQAAIMEAIRAKGFNPLAIPNGEKGTLRIICEADHPDLFDGHTSFDNAWGESRSLFRMANHASYSRRGKA